MTPLLSTANSRAIRRKSKSTSGTSIHNELEQIYEMNSLTRTPNALISHPFYFSFLSIHYHNSRSSFVLISSQFLIFLLFLNIYPIQIAGNVDRLTRDEASHTGLPYHDPPIINEFNTFLEEYSSSSIKHLNDFTQHHSIIKYFCHQRDTQSCQWFEYYQILDSLRLPFSNSFDPGMKRGIKINEIQQQYQSGPFQKKCDVIKNPTSDEFLQYVLGSHPVIIQGDILPSSFDSTFWSLANLVDILGNNQIVVSATPTSEFDGPEDPLLWGIPPEKNDSIKYELIVRPAHINLLFSEFATLLTSLETRNKSQLYLEYFPLYAMFHSPQQKKRPEQRPQEQQKKNKLLQQLPYYSFANWLSMKYQLLWMGGGGGGGGGDGGDDNGNDKRRSRPHKISKQTLIEQEVFVPISRMHYDRMENLMTMIRGKKRFYLYDPDQSQSLYGGTPMRQASFKAELHRDSIHGNMSIQYSRDPSTVQMEPNLYHTYSPVNVRHPNYKTYPKLRSAKGIICEIEEGDTLYVPSHWWHEVVSFPDDEGKSIGINSFFEPFYHRYGYNTTSDLFQKNRYYEPIDLQESTHLCGKNEESCYVHSITREASSKIENFPHNNRQEEEKEKEEEEDEDEDEDEIHLSRNKYFNHKKSPKRRKQMKMKSNEKRIQRSKRGEGRRRRQRKHFPHQPEL